MASITIRNLDPATKQALRESAARNGRSMEEEARRLLGAVAAPVHPDRSPTSSPASPMPPAPERLSRSGLSDYPAAGRRLLLVMTGGIAAYKSLDLIRRLRERGVRLRCVMTAAAREFVTPMAAGALLGDRVFTDMWDRDSEHDIGHVRLAREAELVVVAPATADFLARMAHGLAGDLAGAVLLATAAPVLVAPAMNPQMWSAAATRRNVAALRADGVAFVGPESGEMAESGEAGLGRMAEPMQIVARIGEMLAPQAGPLSGRSAVVTSGPTHEPIDPVRYIANRSSGKQGHAIARALAAAGARVTLVSGPVALDDPPGVDTVHVETAREMAAAVEAALPADIAVMVAAVADWRAAAAAGEKMKKSADGVPPRLDLVENPDILRTVGHHDRRPVLVIGFAAETEHVSAHARDKRRRKGADWILANDVSPETGVMGGDRNAIRLITAGGEESWPEMTKDQLARRLVGRIGEWIARHSAET